jgi:hypothetical protein
MMKARPRFPKLTHGWCNECGRLTEHNVLKGTLSTAYSEDGESSESTTRLLLECRGCRACSIREESRWSEEAGELSVRYIPPRLWTRAPTWLADIMTFDEKLHPLLKEIYTAANDEQFRLMAMGVRAALDHVMTRILGGDVGSFDRKLKEMVKRDHLSNAQSKMLATVIDAGSAAAHRGYRPPRQLLEQMLAVMESVIRDHYVTGPMLETHRKMIPPRPPSQRVAPVPSGTDVNVRRLFATVRPQKKGRRARF